MLHAELRQKSSGHGGLEKIDGQQSLLLSDNTMQRYLQLLDIIMCIEFYNVILHDESCINKTPEKSFSSRFTLLSALYLRCGLRGATCALPIVLLGRI